MKLIAMLFAASGMVLAADENPDLEFLEWLGQVAEVEAMGVDVDSLMDNQSETEESEQEQSE